jgi:hypothetical protein
MSIYKKKLGEEVTKEEMGVLENIFTGKIRLMKITYTVQDEDGVTMDASLIHKDYIHEEDDEEQINPKEKI